MAKCKTPGEQLRSGGKGRGLARGDGSGPLGVPWGTPEDEDEENSCETPGEKKRSGGKGRGLARGKGKGPRGIPIGEKNASISDMYKLGYELGMREKLSQIAAAPPPTNMPGVNAPDWPTQMPQAGGQTTPIADIKAQAQPNPPPLNKTLTPGV